MDTQNKSIQFKFKINYAAAKNYGESFATFAPIAAFIVSILVLSYFIPSVIAFAVSVVLGFVLHKKMSASFNKVRIAALEENRRVMDEVIAPYGLFSYYDGGIEYLDRVDFYDKETDEMYRSAAGHVNGDVATIVIKKD